MVKFNRTSQELNKGRDTNNLSAFTLAKIRLAAHPNAKAACLSRLAQHSCEQIVIRVAENINTPADILALLSKHQCNEVRIAVAENASTPFLVLMELVEDKNVDVRYSLSENHNVPTTLLTVLLDDENPYIGARARKTLDRIKTTQSPALSWFPQIWRSNRNRQSS